MPTSNLTCSALAATLAALAAAPPVLAADGQLDANFGTGGVMVIAWDHGGAKNDYIGDLVSDGTSLFGVGYGSSITGDDDWEIARIDEDGTVTRADTFFDLGAGKNDHALAAVLDGDQLVVAGTADAAFRNVLQVCRYAKSDLAMDTGFGSAGCASIDEGPFVSFSVAGIAVAADGGYVIGGTFYELSNQGFYAAKLTSAGILDGNFGASGIRVLQFDQVTGGEDFVKGLALANDGGILLAGGVEVAVGDHRGAVARLTPAGSLDTSFAGGTGLFLWSNIDNWAMAITARAMDTDADFGTYFTLVGPTAPKIDAVSGVFHNTGSNVGWQAAPGSAFITRMRYEGDGKTFIAGYVDGSNGAELTSSRMPLGALGNLDTTWGSNSIATFSPYVQGFGTGSAPVTAAIWGGRLVVAAAADGNGNEDWILVRLTNSFVFADGFETGRTDQWSAHP